MVLISLCPAFGQWTDDGHPCGTQSPVSFEQENVLVSLSSPINSIRNSNDYIIPIVFHVIHQGGPENVSRATILAALENLNKDFNRQNSDTLNIPLVFQQARANPRILFRLASLDPQGNCTDGITRTFSNKGNSINNGGDLDAAILPWPTDKYLNVYIANHITSGTTYLNITGQSSIPGILGDVSGGLFNDYIRVRSDDLLTSTISHEVGHWLALYHVFSTSCSGIGDRVNDTPNQSMPNQNCPIFPSISCPNESIGDNFNNYMDYSSCQNMFTNGQVFRMHYCLDSFPQRANLWSAGNLISTGTIEPQNNPCHFLPKAEFSMSNYAMQECSGNEVIFNDASNFEPTSWHWTFEGGQPNSSTIPSPVITYPNNGVFNVKLIATNQYGSDTISRNINIKYKNLAYGDSQTENFENDSLNINIASFIMPNPPLFNSPWVIVDSVGYSANHSIYLKSQGTYISSFTTNTFNLNELMPTGRKLSFYISHARDTSINYNDGGNTRLLISWKKPCKFDRIDVSSFYLSRLIGTITDDSLLTALIQSNPSEVFVPNTSQWKKVVFDIPDSLSGEIQFNFGWRTNYNNGPFNNANWFRGVYIDDISTSGLPVATREVLTNDDWTIFPNPANSMVNYKIDKKIQPVQLLLYDMTGNIVISKNNVPENGSIDVSLLPSGIYFIKILHKQGALCKQIISIK